MLTPYVIFIPNEIEILGARRRGAPRQSCRTSSGGRSKRGAGDLGCLSGSLSDFQTKILGVYQILGSDSGGLSDFYIEISGFSRRWIIADNIANNVADNFADNIADNIADNPSKFQSKNRINSRKVDENLFCPPVWNCRDDARPLRHGAPRRRAPTVCMSAITHGRRRNSG